MTILNFVLDRIHCSTCFLGRIFGHQQLNMTSADSAYAIYFNEGPGYLFVSNLGHGTCGKAMLVRSCAFPHNLYVRKRVLDQERRIDGDAHHDEVSHYRQFKQIPKLIDWTSYGRKSYSITTEFCNGGSLRDLLFRTLLNDSRPIAEVFVWRVFIQLLETLEYLHRRCRHTVVHNDILPQNVFLHWPEESIAGQPERKHHLPDVYLGDFGIATLVSRGGSAQEDLRMLHTLVIAVCLGSTRDPFCVQGWKTRFPHVYSKELRRCLDVLPEPWDFDGPNKCLGKTAATNVLRAQIMPIAQRKMAELEGKQLKVDYRFTKPSPKTAVTIKQAKSEFDCEKIDEPFRYALVNEVTFDVIAVEAKPRTLTPQRSGKGCIAH